MLTGDRRVIEVQAQVLRHHGSEGEDSRGHISKLHALCFLRQFPNLPKLFIPTTETVLRNSAHLCHGLFPTDFLRNKKKPFFKNARSLRHQHEQCGALPAGRLLERQPGAIVDQWEARDSDGTIAGHGKPERVVPVRLDRLRRTE